MNTEKKITAKSGIPMLIIMLLALVADLALLIFAGKSQLVLLMVLAIVFIPVWIVMMVGFFMVNPNESKVLQLFGKYVGTVSDPGLRWANPFYAKKSRFLARAQF